MMSNQALPKKSRQLLANYLDKCQNLGLILDKFAPWGEGVRGDWDLTMQNTVRRGGQNQIQPLTGGEAKGLWLNTQRRALKGESASLFEAPRVDETLLQESFQRWLHWIKASDGIAFTMRTSERFAAGLGASHVLETSLTLERNTGFPYLPGSSVKGLTRAWGLIEVASQLNISLDDKETVKGEPEALLNIIAEVLISEPEETLLHKLGSFCPVSKDAEVFVQLFRFIFGWQGQSGAICFADAKYAGDAAPKYAADVMTPHYVKYYTENGGSSPADDDSPNPVSFLTVDRGNVFAFGLIPRISAFSQFDDNEREEKIGMALEIACDWLRRALTKLGAGSKTTAGYGFFNAKSAKIVVEH